MTVVAQLQEDLSVWGVSESSWDVRRRPLLSGTGLLVLVQIETLSVGLYGRSPRRSKDRPDGV